MNDDSPQAGIDARAYVEALLSRALQMEASDLHLEPIPSGVETKLRIDGVLQKIETIPPDLGTAAILRLMVLGQLLTYRMDIPQEGRIRWDAPNRPVDLRLAVMPVAHGMRAVVRLPGGIDQLRALDDLALPARATTALTKFARSGGAEGDAGGMLLVTGPAGSGKTTTIYALLSHIAATSDGLSIISLEDPIERLVPGITQIEITPHGQLTYDRALKSILRQDPQVLMLGAIRDAATASLAVQAALSGHRLIATMHAGDPAAAIARLLEMGIEPYQITSSLFGILTQRLLRRRTEAGYKGRLPAAEFAELTAPIRTAILQRADAATLRTLLTQDPTYQTLRASAEAAVQAGITDHPELTRVLG
jgi:type II secretory ATPase GspE/PulE/Tfp pilus assembly ATPase PilB-like protein